jgi:adenosylcobinamide kinase/adenosylcobinamide-phosphate guanylyltransferase
MRPPISFIATALALDDEMKARIIRHQEERTKGRGGYRTIEEPVELHQALAQAGGFAVVDCLAMWVNNLMYYEREGDFQDILGASLDILDSYNGVERHCVIVTNETGLGNIPFDALTRRYNLLLAEANRRIAAVAHRVEFMVSGIPLMVKGGKLDGVYYD